MFARSLLDRVNTLSHRSVRALSKTLHACVLQLTIALAEGVDESFQLVPPAAVNNDNTYRSLAMTL